MKNKFGCFLLCCLLIFHLASCSQKIKNTESAPGAFAQFPNEIEPEAGLSSAETDVFVQGGSAENVPTPSIDITFSAKDGDASYNSETAVSIVFSENAVTANGSGVSIDKTKVDIVSGGTYIVSGNCRDGKLTVNVSKNEKVKIVLAGVDLTCQSGAVLVIEEADKVFITLAEESQNTLADGASYTETIGEDKNVDGAIYSRADLTINGSGALIVKGNNKHAIVSKDDLVLSGKGSVLVTAAGAGLEGKDCVKIRDMQISITAEGDGIRSTNTEQSDRGFVYVESGDIQISCNGDGISSETLLQIAGGMLNIQTGGGSAKAPVKSESGMGGGFRPGNSSSSNQSNSVSRKGLKCSGTLLIQNGTIVIDAYDDGLHSDGDLAVEGGITEIASGDDGVHANEILEIAGGKLSVSQSYEGLEGKQIYIRGGNISLVSSDDGLNASGGSGGGFGSGSNGAYLCIEGGYLFVNASGDGLDSNGNFDMKGGIVLVSGPNASMNGALDYGDGCKGTVSGGILIAAGSTSMAENFSNAENQGSILVSTGSCQGGTSLAICDANGKVLASFTPPKSYQCAVITTPEMQKGGSYTVYTGAKVENADGNGFASEGTLTGGSKVATVELTALLYGGMGGGGMRPPSGGNFGGGGMRPGRP